MIIKHQHFELQNKTVLERFVFKPPFKLDGSMHDEACFLFAVNGIADLYGATETTQFSSNESVLMKCGNYLNSWQRSTDGRPFEAVAVHFYPEVLKYVYQDKLPNFLLGKDVKNKVSVEKLKVDEMINKYVESLIFYFENPSMVTEELIILKVKELILLLLNTDDTQNVRSILGDLFDPNTYSLKEIIRAHLYEDHSIDDLATLCNLSTSSFKRKFKEVFEESPKRYIKRKRLEKAADLLRHGQLRITEICYDCGFNDITHFSKSFTKKFEISPSDYREQHLV